MKIQTLVKGVLVTVQLMTAVAAEDEKCARLRRQLGPESTLVARREAAQGLGELGPAAAAAIPELTKAMATDPDPAVRHHSAWALGKIKEPSETIIPALVDALDDEFWSVQHNAMLSLTWIGKPAVPALRAVIDKSNELQSVNALQALGGIEGKLSDAHVALVADFVSSEDPRVATLAVGLAGVLGEEARLSVPGLVRLIDAEDPSMRRLAIKSLGSMGGPAEAAIPKLIEVLKGDKDYWNKVEAALSLGSVAKSHPEAVQALIAALNDKKNRVRSYATDALGMIGAPAVVPLKEILDSGDVRTRRHAVQALGAMKTEAKDAVDALIACLDDPEESIRSAAAYSLGSIGESQEKVTSALERAREREAEGAPVRAHIELALSMLGTKKP
ncbi:MAG: HEAT repeat domain-containing protein [Verrucomicrobiales bacterium]